MISTGQRSHPHLKKHFVTPDALKSTKLHDRQANVALRKTSRQPDFLFRRCPNFLVSATRRT